MKRLMKAMFVATQCMSLKGDFPLKFNWLLNGESIQEHKLGIRILKISPRISGINIDSVSIKHIGNFTCEVSNPAGRKEHIIDLNINGAYCCISFI